MLKVLLLSAMVFAAKEHGAHVHGAGRASLAFDGKKGKIELHLPAESIFGFEYEARSAQDKKKKEKALSDLETKIAEMIVFPAEMKCEIKKEIFEVNQGKNHADIEAEFNVNCEQPLTEKTIAFHFQKTFPRLKKVQVELLADSVQKSMEVTKNGETLDVK
ncbi:MAG: DUF2796 domain-containing protein [Bdellovibrio sp.]